MIMSRTILLHVAMRRSTGTLQFLRENGVCGYTPLDCHVRHYLQSQDQRETSIGACVSKPDSFMTATWTLPIAHSLNGSRKSRASLVKLSGSASMLRRLRKVDGGRILTMA